MLKSLWPDQWSVEDLQVMKAQDPIRFAKEMQNDPRVREDASFDHRDFRRWKQEGTSYKLYDDENHIISEGDLSNCKAAIAGDLAWSDKRADADSTALMPAFLTPDSQMLVAPYLNRQGVKPDELSDWLFSQVDYLTELTGRPIPIGFEKAMLEKVVKWFLEQECKKRNKGLSIETLKWDGDKRRRIEVRLYSRYKSHMIFHQSGMGELEDQLLEFPDGAHDDLLDTEQGLVQLLSEISPPTIGEVKKEDIFEWWSKRTPGYQAAKRRLCRYPPTVMRRIPFTETYQ